MTKNILIIGQPSDNRGDQAAGRAMLYGIKEICPESKITVYYLNKSLTPVLIDETVVENLFKQETGAGSFCFKLLVHFILDKISSKLFMFNEECRQLLKVIKNSTLVLLSPSGPIIGDLYDIRNEMIRLIILFIAQKYKKKTMIYGPSMGPFHENSLRHFIRKIVLNKVDVITVRDEISYGYIKAARLKTKIIERTLDSAIQRSLSADRAVNYYDQLNIDPESEMLIGVTPIDLSWHPKHGKRTDVELFNKKIVDELSRGLNQIQHKLNCRFVFFPQLFGVFEDLSIIKKVINAIDDPEKCTVLSLDHDSDVQQIMISKLKMFIGMRYHSIIFSAKMNVPFVGIVYEHKAESFVSIVNMKDYMIKIEDISGNEIYDKAINVIENHENIKNALTNINDKITAVSFKNTKMLHDLMCKSD